MDVDPVVDVKFQISPGDKIATAGSCFAQHIAGHLDKTGYNHFVAEPGPAFIPEAIRRKFGFGVFSARYGNIYTARQLVQLFDRAYGAFQPVEDVWEDDGAFLDPFRPHVQPIGFRSLAEYQIDREQHFGAVRKVFEQCDAFIFTLGLTEAWLSRADGSVFPICPGCGAGTFAAERYVFHNFDYEEVLTDMRDFRNRFRSVNRSAPVILTVSPVPLVATADRRHVLASTVYSKSVLRAASGKLEELFADVSYFPSYELIAGNPSGDFFGPDRRSVTEEGVELVMRVFARHYCTGAPQASQAASPEPFLPEGWQLLEGVCDEEQLDSMLQAGPDGRG
jgi:hypothetical protein